MTPEQWQVIADKLPAYNAARATAVIRTHAANHNFFSIPEILEGLRADHMRHSQYRRASVGEKIVDGLKREARSTGWIGDEDDVQFLISHFCASWHGVKKNVDATEYGRQTVRKMILQTAITAFGQIGFSESEARETAESCCGLESGERIKIPQAGDEGNLLASA